LNAFIKTSLILTTFVSYLSAVEVKDLSSAINIAGKQRMFTQRLLKDYVMVGMENKFGKPDEDMKKVITSFDDALKSLSTFNKDKSTTDSLKEVQKLWTPIKIKLQEKPTKESANKLQGELETLLKEANNATQLFSKQTKESSGEIINISGRQRMLSQKMASLYMLKVWGLDDEKFKQKMKDTMTLFKESHKKLEKFEKNTPEIKKLLSKVKKSFMFFEFMGRSKSKFIPSLIYKKSNDILKDMNEVTNLYVKSLKK
jgi:nitrate/nitrite-specific signal transduction histidine kinase